MFALPTIRIAAETKVFAGRQVACEEGFPSGRTRLRLRAVTSFGVKLEIAVSAIPALCDRAARGWMAAGLDPLDKLNSPVVGRSAGADQVTDA
jgi:hypothetical protein